MAINSTKAGTGKLFDSLGDFNPVFAIATHYGKLPHEVEAMPAIDVMLSLRALDIQAVHQFMSAKAAQPKEKKKR